MTMQKRLLTKCDIDGMTSGILLKELGLIDTVLFCNPQDIEKGHVQITDNDITAGLPCREHAYLAFDHYQLPDIAQGNHPTIIVDKSMRSTSRVICNYFGRQQFSSIPDELLHVVDKVISADVTLDDILYPAGWMLLSYLIDQRTGLDRYAHFSNSNAELIEMLMDLCRKQTIWEVLNHAPVEERSTCYFAQVDACKSQIMRCTTMYNNLLVVDMRNEEIVYPGNRFMLYALFSECNVSLQVMRHYSGKKTTFIVGKSFLDRSLSTDIGSIMQENGGSGHQNAGICEVDNDQADSVMRNLIAALQYGTLKNLFMGYFNYYYP